MEMQSRASVADRPSSSLSDVLVEIARIGAPTVRMRDVIRPGQRYRRIEDGLIVSVEQVHRVDRLVEVRVSRSGRWGFWRGVRFGVGFDDLAARYELLVGLRGVR